MPEKGTCLRHLGCSFLSIRPMALDVHFQPVIIDSYWFLMAPFTFA
jgi:hypothetical protein